jgi:hypothetical protein
MERGAMKKICSYCGRQFQTYWPTKIYCGNTCRQGAYFERKKEKEMQAGTIYEYGTKVIDISDYPDDDDYSFTELNPTRFERLYWYLFTSLEEPKPWLEMALDNAEALYSRFREFFRDHPIYDSMITTFAREVRNCVQRQKSMPLNEAMIPLQKFLADTRKANPNLIIKTWERSR